MSTSQAAQADRGYHHGDLRASLLRVGLSLLDERNADGLALRELARAVGVSPTAVYRHFPDKRALMSALAAEGLAQLAESQRAASETAGGGNQGFSATGAAYVRFATENPALFRLIFASAGSFDEAEETDAMDLLKANAAALAADSADADLVALRAWSLAHGLAMLMLDDRVNLTTEKIMKVMTVNLATSS